MSFNRRVYRGGGAAAPAFSGNFSSLFTTPAQFMQADKGLTYGGTPKATVGNTSATVMTLAGSTPSTPVPVLVKATNTATVGSGALFNIYYDGVGTTAAMTGVALTATPTPLTGAGSGLTLAATVASSVTNDTWNATAASNADQSGNGLTFAQASASLQPIVTVGANGHVGLLFDGVDDFYACAGLNSFSNMLVWLVVKQITWSAYCAIVASGDNVNKAVIFQDGFTATPNVAAYNGAALGSGALTLGTIGRIGAVFNGASSTVKVGSNALASGDAGSTGVGTGRGIGCDRYAAIPVNFAKVEVFAAGHMTPQSYAAADSRAFSYWGAVI